MRIVGGRLRGHRIETPQTHDIRPTSERVRESVFNMLAHRFDEDVVAGARVLDLFAGTGANAMEALSRGAGFALLVENGVEARGLIRTNLMNLGLQGVARLWRRDATHMGRCAPMPPFDLVFIDPPYGQGLGEKALGSLLAGGWLADDAVIVFEEARGNEIALPEGLVLVEARSYSQTTVHLLRHPAALPASG